MYTLLWHLDTTLCGQIQGADVSLNFGAAKYMTQLSFRFQLNEALTASDYLMVTFPFTLHNLVTTSAYAPPLAQFYQPTQLSVQWVAIDGTTFNLTGPTATTPGGAIILTASAESSVYYIQLLNAD